MLLVEDCLFPEHYDKKIVDLDQRGKVYMKTMPYYLLAICIFFSFMLWWTINDFKNIMVFLLLLATFGCVSFLSYILIWFIGPPLIRIDFYNHYVSILDERNKPDIKMLEVKYEDIKWIKVVKYKELWIANMKLKSGAIYAFESNYYDMPDQLLDFLSNKSIKLLIE